MFRRSYARGAKPRQIQPAFAIDKSRRQGLCGSSSTGLTPAVGMGVPAYMEQHKNGSALVTSVLLTIHFNQADTQTIAREA